LCFVLLGPDGDCADFSGVSRASLFSSLDDAQFNQLYAASWLDRKWLPPTEAKAHFKLQLVELYARSR
jgi:hypothetical protein